VIALPVAAGTGYNYTQMTIDTSQRVWVYSPAAMPLATPVAPAGSMAVYYNYGTLQFTVPAGTAGLTSPSQLFPDAGGKVWALNSNGTLSDFLIGGAENVIVEDAVKIPPFNGSPDATPAGNAPAVGNAMTIDPTGNVWVNYDFSCYIEFDSSETVVLDPVTPTNICPKFTFTSFPSGPMTSDEHGNIYIYAESTSSVFPGPTFSNGVYKLDNSGNLLSPVAGFQPPGVATFANFIQYMTFDHANDVLWMLTDLHSPALFAMKADGTPISGASGVTMPNGFLGAFFMAVDGAGNLWMPDVSGALYEFSPTGAILTPNGTGAGQSGLHPAGLNFPGPIAVDAYGNIWIANWGSNTLLRIPGLAAPKTYQ
jgi:hypothetical protein